MISTMISKVRIRGVYTNILETLQKKARKEIKKRKLSQIVNSLTEEEFEVVMDLNPIGFEPHGVTIYLIEPFSQQKKVVFVHEQDGLKKTYKVEVTKW